MRKHTGLVYMGDYLFLFQAKKTIKIEENE